MTSETRRVPYPITDRMQEHLAGRYVKASQKELIGTVIGFIARNGSRVTSGGCRGRDRIVMELWASAAGEGGPGIYQAWRDLAGCGKMKEKVVRCVQDRTGAVDGGYDYMILAVKRARLEDAGGDVDHAV